MKYLLTIGTTIIMLIFLTLGACSNNSNGDKNEFPQRQESAENPVSTQPLQTITIGNLTDMTGPAASAMHIVDEALADLVQHYNDENIIPGVELEIINYDGQMDPSKVIPGYQWLIEKGADLIFTGPPPYPVVLNPRVDQDQVVLFAATGNPEDFAPSGFAFNLGTLPEHEAHILLNWIAENDWDYQTDGPARIGGASWDDPYAISFFEACKEYAQVHPNQFEWVGGHLTNYSFTWGPEVEALKDCDYLFPPTMMTNFVKEYRTAGHTAKFIGTDTHTAFLGLIADADLWDEIDGMIFVRHPRWWTETGAIIDLTKELLYENHPDDAEEIMSDGAAYLGITPGYLMLNVIANAVESVGSTNFDSQALYEAAKSFSLTVDDIERYSFGETKRYVVDYYGIYKAKSADQNLFRAYPEWLPVSTEP